MATSVRFEVDETELQGTLFPSRLRDSREAAKLTVLGLADRLSVAPKTIERWEEGESNPSVDKAAEAAEILGVSLDFLAGLENGEAA